MKIARVLLVVSLLGFTGCNKLKEAFGGTHSTQADASAICRATPGWWNMPVTSDNIDILTGEIQGEDGITMTAYACPTAGKIGEVAGCSVFTSTGADANGVVVEFTGIHVFFKLAATNHYARVMLRMDATCHGD